MVNYILGKGGHASVIAGRINAREISEDEEYMIDPLDGLIVGIGIGIDIGIPRDRIRLFEKYGRGRFINSIDKSAVISESAFFKGSGIDVGVLAMVGPNARIGDNVLINHGAQVAHDCKIGDHCIISAGAILCGEVTLGRACAIGAGAIIVQKVELPDESRVPAGTLVVSANDFRKPVPMVRTD